MGRRRRTRDDGVDLIRVRSLIAEGYSDEQIARDMRITVTETVAARRKIVGQGLMEVGPSRPIGEVFTEHRFRMLGIVEDLDVLAEDCREDKPHISLGALKAKAKIYDGILERGQELGVLPRAARQSGTKVSVGVAVAVGAVGSMTNPELVTHLGDLNRKGDQLKGDYGDEDFLGLPNADIYEAADVVEAEPVPIKVVRRKA